MQNKKSNHSKYILAALLGAAVGGSGIALTSRAVPELMAGMEAKCKRMMAAMAEGGCQAGDTCKQMRQGMGPASECATCQSSCES